MAVQKAALRLRVAKGRGRVGFARIHLRRLRQRQLRQLQLLLPQKERLLLRLRLRKQ